MNSFTVSEKPSGIIDSYFSALSGSSWGKPCPLMLRAKAIERARVMIEGLPACIRGLLTPEFRVNPVSMRNDIEPVIRITNSGVILVRRHTPEERFDMYIHDYGIERKNFTCCADHFSHLSDMSAYFYSKPDNIYAGVPSRECHQAAVVFAAGSEILCKFKFDHRRFSSINRHSNASGNFSLRCGAKDNDFILSFKITKTVNYNEVGGVKNYDMNFSIPEELIECTDSIKSDISRVRFSESFSEIVKNMIETISGIEDSNVR